MHTMTAQTNGRQRAFSEICIVTLLYVTVLGFFSEYTDIVYIKSFSYLFIAAVILGVLTWATFWLKDKIVSHFSKNRKYMMVIGVWLVMFLSKFVFVEAIDFVLGSNVNIYGYFGIVAVISSTTLAQKLADVVYKKL